MSTSEILLPTPLYTITTPTPRPYIQIVEQPFKSLRFRYGCEGRPGTIVGVSSTPDNKIPFAIQIVGYNGRVQVVVSCVTKDQPYKPHPHNLVGLNCRKGVCSFETAVTPENSIITFPKMAVQCVKRTNVVEALRVREEKNIDPFLAGFAHKDNVKSIDLNVVRLCFQVFLKSDDRSQRVLTPVVSNPIYNKKTLPDPLIYRLSHCNSPVDGRNEDIILVCTKIIKDDIKIRFFEMEYGQVIWEDFGTFHPNHIYNNTAICFRPPQYRRQDITEPVKVLVQLVRPSDGVVSSPVDFEYLPIKEAPVVLREKRKKYQDSPLFEQLLQDVTDGARTKYFRFDRSSIEATTNFLMDSTPWNLPQPQELMPDLPLVINDIDSSEASSSRRTSGQDDLTNWNITSEDFSGGTNINLESATAIRQVLNIDCSQIELEPIHISSGDLEMNDMDKLSGTFKEYLVM